jgi:DNA-binding HxlR family transcriptional regulator
MESIMLTEAELAEIGKDTLRFIGNRGTLEILSLFCCSDRKIRFGELSSLLKHISTKTLASRLKELEKNGLLNRIAYNEIPPRVEYSMTEKGQSLAEALNPLIRWMIQRPKIGKLSVAHPKKSGDFDDPHRYCPSATSNRSMSDE